MNRNMNSLHTASSPKIRVLSKSNIKENKFRMKLSDETSEFSSTHSSGRISALSKVTPNTSRNINSRYEPQGLKYTATFNMLKVNKLSKSSKGPDKSASVSVSLPVNKMSSTSLSKFYPSNSTSSDHSPKKYDYQDSKNKFAFDIIASKKDKNEEKMKIRKLSLFCKETFQDKMKEKLIERENDELRVKSLEFWDKHILREEQDLNNNVNKVNFNQTSQEEDKKNYDSSRSPHESKAAIKLRSANKKKTLTTLVAEYIKNNPDSEMNRVREFQTLNKKNEIRESFNKIQSKFYSPSLKNFYKKMDQEQGAILLQNINLTKRSFNFDVLNRNSKKLSDKDNLPIIKNSNYIDIIEEGKDKIIENEFVQVGNRIAFKRKGDPESKRGDNTERNSFTERNSATEGNSATERIHSNRRRSSNNLDLLEENSQEEEEDLLDHKFVKVDDPFLKCNNLKLEGNYDLLVSQDYYRKTVTEKIRVEATFRKEMMRLAKLIYERKIERQKIIDKNAELSETMHQAKENYTVKKEAMDVWMKKVERTVEKRLTSKHSHPDSAHRRSSTSSSLDFEFNAKFSHDINVKQDEVDAVYKSFQEVKQKCEKLMTENNSRISKFENEVKTAKILLTDLMKDQTSYYLDLLSKGIDVRSEGLCWIVRKLIELNARFDQNSFPKFLEGSQVDYIISLAKKQVEAIQFNLILKIMKNRKKKLRGDREGDYLKTVDSFDFTEKNFDKTGKFSIKTGNSDKNVNIVNGVDKKILTEIASGFYNQSLSKLILKVFSNLFKQNETNLKLSYEQRLQDFQTDKLINELKKKIKFNTPTYSYVDDERDHFMLPNFIVDNENEFNSDDLHKMNPLLDYFSENLQEKEIFEDILVLRNNLLELEKEIEQMKETQMRNFKIKYEVFKRGSARQSVHYDLMYACLFGNHVVF